VRWPKPSRFRTKLALAIVFLFFLAVALLLAVDTFNERRLIENLENTTEAVTKAIEVASDQAQLSSTGAIDTEILQDYAQKLRRHGVREIQILNPERTVIASSRARAGRPRTRKGAAPNISITGTISEDSDAAGPTKTYRLIMPIISRNEKVGYVTVDLILDDYSAMLSRNFERRIAAVAVVFGAGLLLLLLLTTNFTRPIAELAAAAGRVADGDLNAEVHEKRTDDVGALVDTWNAMLARLREQRDLESRLAAAERTASLGHLASGIAHEIRNPLNTISLGVDYLRRRFPPADPAGRREFVRTAESLRGEIARLNQLITDFLSYGKPSEIRREAVDVGALLREVADEIAREAEPRGVRVLLEPGPRCRIAADRGLLKSAFFNVALNAVQLMGPGGALRIAARPGADGCRVQFDDDGPGIPAANVSKIFEPYFSTRDGGVGLGLAMTHKIIADHGGDIRAENLPRGGTRFELVLPASGAQRAAG
jgi:signal transduction histidine kinase